MNDPKTFDHFLLSLNEKINENTDKRKDIIKAAYLKSGCPYLKEKILGGEEKSPSKGL